MIITRELKQIFQWHIVNDDDNDYEPEWIPASKWQPCKAIAILRKALEGDAEDCDYRVL